MLDIPTRSKDPSAVGPFHVIWCDPSGLNDGSRQDKGFLQGDTIATSTWTVPGGITDDSDNTDAVTVAGLAFAVDTVATVVLSGGTAGTRYLLVNHIVTGDGREEDQSLFIQVEQH